MYLSTSQDILFLVLAFAVLWITIFLSWMLYHLIGILRDARETVHGLRKAADAVETAMSHIKGKFEAIVNLVGLFGEGIKAVMSRLAERVEEDEDGGGRRRKRG